MTKTNWEHGHTLIEHSIMLFAYVLKLFIEPENEHIVVTSLKEIFEAIIAMDHVLRKTYEITKSYHYMQVFMSESVEALQKLKKEYKIYDSSYKFFFSLSFSNLTLLKESLQNLPDVDLDIEWLSHLLKISILAYKSKLHHNKNLLDYFTVIHDREELIVFFDKIRAQIIKQKDD